LDLITAVDDQTTTGVALETISRRIVLLVLSPLLYKFTVFIGTQNSPIGSGSRTAQELGHRLNLIGLTLLILQAIVNLATDVIATS